MCGIVGKIDFDGPVDPEVVRSMCERIVHRGPDSDGFHFEPHVGLGMRRLAIIDVSNGDQPIYNEDRSVVVVMNGEIYNFQEVREMLRRRGHVLGTQGDTEVLVHLYEEFGEDMCRHLRGMFAFALWDGKAQRLLLGRDRIGKKPLFFSQRGRSVTFASELGALISDPSIPRAVNPEAIAAYLSLQYVPNPMSAFDGVFKVPPATLMSIDQAGIREQAYWELDHSAKIDERTSREEMAERLRSELKDAVRARLVSEVPLGAFLSGGIDSSAVVGIMAEELTDPVKTFTIGFRDSDWNEAPYAREVAEWFATDHHELIVEPSALDVMPLMARHYGEPFADPSAIPTFYLAEMTAKHVTVALSGDGGDESFGGYSRYRLGAIDRLAQMMPQAALRSIYDFLGPPSRYSSAPKSFAARASRFIHFRGGTRDQVYLRRIAAFSDYDRERFFQPGFLDALGDFSPDDSVRVRYARSSGAELDRLMSVDIATYLPDDLLVKMDIASMAHSLEVRSPFLDHNLMEFAASLPARAKGNRTSGKVILVEALRGFVPDSVLDRRKAGFGVPLAGWFRGDLRDLPSEMLMGSGAAVQAYVRPEAIETMITEHRSGVADHAIRIWTLLQLECWYEEVVRGSAFG